MMKTQASSSVAVSRATFGWNVITPPRARSAPTTRTKPSTSSAVANSDPTIALWATTRSPLFSANSTTNSSGRLPSVACRSPVAAGPMCPPTCSVENDTIQASPPSATVAMHERRQRRPVRRSARRRSPRRAARSPRRARARTSSCAGAYAAGASVLLEDAVDQPYSRACSALKKRSRSMSRGPPRPFARRQRRSRRRARAP